MGGFVACLHGDTQLSEPATCQPVRLWLWLWDAVKAKD